MAFVRNVRSLTKHNANKSMQFRQKKTGEKHQKSRQESISKWICHFESDWSLSTVWLALCCSMLFSSFYSTLWWHFSLQLIYDCAKWWLYRIISHFPRVPSVYVFDWIRILFHPGAIREIHLHTTTTTATMPVENRNCRKNTKNLI